jgi:hypothetical protein
MPLVACTEPRCIIQLKVKGTHSSSELRMGRATLHSGSFPLFNNFPFTKLTVEEISDLFRSYRIKLGDNIQHREHIIHAIQTNSRTSFKNTIR